VDNRFAVNLDDLKASSEGYGDVADSAYRIPLTVSNKVGDPNLIAGADQYGQLYASRIAPAIEGATQLLNGVGDGIHNTSKMILTTHDFYAKADDINAEQAGNLANHVVNP
jgi:hypothetical protein